MPTKPDVWTCPDCHGTRLYISPRFAWLVDGGKFVRQACDAEPIEQVSADDPVQCVACDWSGTVAETLLPADLRKPEGPTEPKAPSPMVLTGSDWGRVLPNPDLARPEGLSRLGDLAYEAIMGLLVERGTTFTGGCKAFRSPAEWKERREEYGCKSELIVVHDGGDIACYCNYDREDYEAIEAMRAALEKVSCYIENEASWYSAVYPIRRG